MFFLLILSKIFQNTFYLIALSDTKAKLDQREEEEKKKARVLLNKVRQSFVYSKSKFSLTTKSSLTQPTLWIRPRVL